MERYKKTPELKPLAKNQLAQNDSFGCNFVCMRLAEIQNNSRILHHLSVYASALQCKKKKDLYEEAKKSEKKSSTLCVGAHTTQHTHTVTK